MTTPMVEVADRRDSGQVAMAFALLAANTVMLGAGAGLLWRRCSQRQAASQL